MMWSFTSNAIAGTMGPKTGCPKPNQAGSDCSDDEGSSNISRDEGLECQICWESFNIVENVPYVLWCGHTLCKNCVLGLQAAVVKFPTLPVQLPLFISCPWCHMLSFRLVYKGNLKFPRKNFFLLWMVESMNGDRDRPKSHSSYCAEGGSLLGNEGHHQVHHHSRRAAPQYLHSDHQSPHQNPNDGNSFGNYLNVTRIHVSLCKSLVFFVHMTAKFPLVVIFLLIVLYAIPASAAILALYILITVLFALPSFLILYFAYPSLDWLVREIIT